MLNLNNPIIFTDDEKKLVDGIMAVKEGEVAKSGSELWEIGTKEVKALKSRISKWTLTEQKCRCAYCERLLEQGTTFIEHFVPKSKHREFVFEPENMFSACGRCNYTGIKGSKETLNLPLQPQYRNNTFTIVHPFIDNPDSEIVFTDESRIVFDKVKCTPKGLSTIDFFHWDDKDAVLTRTKEAPFRNEPMDVKKYVLLIATYRG